MNTEQPSQGSHPPLVIGVLPGEGVGPEVISAALDALHSLCDRCDRVLDLRTGGAIGNDALRLHGRSLSAETEAFCDAVFADGGAVFCGPGGARFVYELRRRFDLFCKLTPLQPLPSLCDASLLRPERLADVDIVAVRENTGGLYFGQWGRDGDAQNDSAWHGFGYDARQVDRILEVALAVAAARRRRLCLVAKCEGVPAISQLWIEHFQQRLQGGDIEGEILDVDNAAYQLIADPQRFDVIVSSNMLGDILADCGAVLLGSRGLSYSGNFDGYDRAVYQTGHGAAYDIAGSDCANPAGQMYALAMMLERSFDWPQGAALLRGAMDFVFASGFRTIDVAAAGSRVVGTREFGQRVACAIAELVPAVTA